MVKWGTILGAFDIWYLSRTTVKGQILTDLIVEFTECTEQIDPEEVEVPENKVMINVVSPQLSWELFVDRATNQKGLRI